MGYAFHLAKVHYALRVAGDNLTNKRAWTSVGASLASGALPRLVKFSLSAAF